MSTGILGKLQIFIDILCYFSHGQHLFEEEKPSKYIDFLGIYVHGSLGKVSYMYSDFKGPTGS